MRVLPILALVACSETGVLQSYPLPELQFELTSPTYGMFVGDGALLVAGKTGSSETVVVVEGNVVPVRPDGTFEYRLPVNKPYRIVDVTADLYDQHAEARVPVFDGTDPRLTWPGAVAMRLTPSGLTGFADLLLASAEALLSEEAIVGLLPPTDLLGTEIAIDRVTRRPLQLDLLPTDAGIVAKFKMVDLAITIVARGDIFGLDYEVPATLTFPKVTLDSTISTGLGEQGDLQLVIGQPVIGFDTPVVAIDQLGFGWLSDLLLGWLDLGQLITDGIDTLVGDLAPISLGDPIALETDLLGTSLALMTSEVRTDADGVAIGLGVGIDAPVTPGPIAIPYPTGAFADATDLTVAVHEGLLQVLLDSDLLSLLEQDITLPGFLGGFLGNLVKGLPGGEDAPDAYGWCVSLDPGAARVARFREGDTLLGIYLPDATVRFGTLEEQGDTDCEDWLVTSLALEVGFTVTDGTKLSFSIGAPEGKVLYYGTDDYEEAELIGRLGGTLSSLLDLLGGFAEIDLAELLGADALLGDAGASLGVDLSGIALEIRGAQPMRDAGGAPIDGLYEVGVQLFAPAP